MSMSVSLHHQPLLDASHCSLSSSVTPKAYAFGAAAEFSATPCSNSSFSTTSSTPASAVSSCSSHSLALPRAVSLSARTIADAHAALEALCALSSSRPFSPTVCSGVAQAVSSDDDSWLPRTTSQPSAVTVFDSAVVPSISLGEYGVALTSRIPHLNSELTLAAVVLCRRYISATRAPPTASMMHRLYATAFYIAMCSHCDVVVTPSDFASVAGLAPSEMPRLTRTLLLAVDWRTQVTRDQLETLVAACDPLL